MTASSFTFSQKRILHGLHPFQFANLLLQHSQWPQYKKLGLASKCEDDNNYRSNSLFYYSGI